MTTRLQWAPARCASLLVHAVSGEINAQGMRLKRRMVFPLVSYIDRHGIVQVRPGRIWLVSRFQMIGKMRIRRRRDRKRGDVDRMAGFLLLGGRDHPFPSFDDRLFHRHRSMNAVEFVVQACAEFSSRTIQAERRNIKNSLPHALQIVRPLSSRRHNGVMVVPQFWQERTRLAVFWAGGESRGTGLGLVSSCDVSAAAKSSFATGSWLVRRGGSCETGT